jgi:chloramphenicol 3-O-phosphotransferase
MIMQPNGCMNTRDSRPFFETDRCALRGPHGRRELQTSEREEVVTRGAAFAIRGYLEAGVDLVVEVGLWRPTARRMAAAVFEPFDAWLLGLRWDLGELERREGQRDDGILPGTGRTQATPSEAWTLPYDFEVDAVRNTPAAAAQQVVDWLSTGPTPRAIRRIASS